MNRKKALFYHEWKMMRWFLLAGLACCLGVVFLLSWQCNNHLVSLVDVVVMGDNGEGFGSILINELSDFSPLAILAVLVMAVFQFSDFHKKNRREYILSLPFTQRESFAVKFIMGCSVLTIICAVFAVGVFALRGVYYEAYIKPYLLIPAWKLIAANDTWMHTLRAVLTLWLLMLAVYAVAAAVHSLVTEGVTAVLICIGALAAPVSLFFMIDSYIQNPPDLFSSYPGLFQGVCGLLGDGYGSTYEYTGITPGDMNWGAYADVSHIDDYGSVNIVLSILAVVFFASSLLAFFVNGRRDAAKSGKLIPDRWARALISGGMAFFFSFPVSLLLLTVIWLIMGLSQDLIDQVFLRLFVQAASAVPLYVLWQKIFRINRR